MNQIKSLSDKERRLLINVERAVRLAVSRHLHEMTAHQETRDLCERYRTALRKVTEAIPLDYAAHKIALKALED